MIYIVELEVKDEVVKRNSIDVTEQVKDLVLFNNMLSLTTKDTREGRKERREFEEKIFDITNSLYLKCYSVMSPFIPDEELCEAGVVILKLIEFTDAVHQKNGFSKFKSVIHSAWQVC